MFYYFYENGEVSCEGMYDNGKEEGEWFWLNLDGTVTVETYKKGKLVDTYDIKPVEE